MTYRRESRRIPAFNQTSKALLPAAALYSLAVLALEHILTSAFTVHGLLEGNASALNLRVPIPYVPLTVSVSPLIHLIPACVMVTLLSSWIHVTKHALFPPRRRAKTKAPRRVKRGLPRRKKGVYSKVGGYLRSLTSLWGKVKSPFNRLHLSSMPLVKAAVKGAFVTLSAFSVLAVLVYLLEYPQPLYEAANLYSGNPYLLNIVYGLLEAFSGLKVTWKYLICQNLAALASASASIIYGRRRMAER
ncbi:hypothetical protein CW711_05850 [Candidatus Bathyarchaeota archaeon]|nr:MAG: hypothetical protein CW711_05850 [Candidatus Bathyarchaeota archaeon]RLG97746.1 MAG: hypothetical protein DRO29_02475 [Candidatus Bathyarchaeota archaeon]HDJ04439.1 hypothetical protein [Candidatus Bathyarchaeota archaeon]